MEDPVRIAIAVVVIVYSLVLHEYAHVGSAYLMGDRTGKEMGRLTLNPIPHIDIFWTIILPVLMFIVARFPIGGPKPAPVNPLNFRNPRAGMMLSAMAGPGTNLLLSAAALGLLWTIHKLAPGWAAPDSYNSLFLFSVIYINVVLAAINLLPVPPLDGSRLLHYILGPSSDPFFAWFERLGWLTIIPIFLAFKYLAPFILVPFIFGLNHLLIGMFDTPYVRTLFTTFYQ